METTLPAVPTQRLFLALWPDEALRATLATVAESLPLRAGRLVPARNLHVTLVFLGAVDAARRECIERAVTTVHNPAFEFTLNRVSWRRRTGIVWMTCDETPGEIERLVDGLNAALAACDHAPETRPYRLHVTLARNARLGRFEHTVASIRWRASEFCLVSSRTTSQGSEYTVEGSWPLQ